MPSHQANRPIGPLNSNGPRNKQRTVALRAGQAFPSGDPYMPARTAIFPRHFIEDVVDDYSAVERGMQLADLRWHWGDAYEINWSGVPWCSPGQRLGAGGRVDGRAAGS